MSRPKSSEIAELFACIDSAGRTCLHWLVELGDVQGLACVAKHRRLDKAERWEVDFWQESRYCFDVQLSAEYLLSHPEIDFHDGHLGKRGAFYDLKDNNGETVLDLAKRSTVAAELLPPPHIVHQHTSPARNIQLQMSPARYAFSRKNPFTV